MSADPSIEQPLISFCLFFYNHEKFVKAAMEGALAQTYSPLEIIASDDSSQDRTYDILKEVSAHYNGPHRIVLNRNSKNMGLIPHMNKVFELTSGKIIICAGGDDISLPERTNILKKVYDTDSEIMSVVSNYYGIDFTGADLPEYRGWNGLTKDTVIKNRDLFSKSSCPIIGAARSFRRELLTKFGPFRPAPCEDVFIKFRALVLGKDAYTEEKLIHYRTNNPESSTVANLNDFRKQIAVYEVLLEEVDYALEKGYLSSKEAASWKREITAIAQEKQRAHDFSQNMTLSRLFPLLSLRPSRYLQNARFIRRYLRNLLFSSKK